MTYMQEKNAILEFASKTYLDNPDAQEDTDKLRLTRYDGVRQNFLFSQLWGAEPNSKND